ncbi:MAG: hypothetical protein LBR25_03415 [Erysipelotrichaceae bacterium]|nr:hypothetical protein [Erysipelotrichaceae bacterium]
MTNRIRKYLISFLVVFLTVVPATVRIRAVDYGFCNIGTTGVGFDLGADNSGAGWSYEAASGTVTLTANQDNISCTRGADFPNPLITLKYEGNLTINSTLEGDYIEIVGNGKNGDLLTVTGAINSTGKISLTNANIEAPQFSGAVVVLDNSTLHSPNGFSAAAGGYQGNLNTKNSTIIVDGQNNAGMTLNYALFDTGSLTEVSNSANIAIDADGSTVTVQGDAIIQISDAANIGLKATSLLIGGTAQLHVSGAPAVAGIDAGASITMVQQAKIIMDAPMIVTTDLIIELLPGALLDIEVPDGTAAVQVKDTNGYLGIRKGDILEPEGARVAVEDGILTIVTDDGVVSNLSIVMHVLDSITITPQNPVAVKGSSLTFKATLHGTHIVDTVVTWSLEGTPTSIHTLINESGLLIIGADETATDLRVKATSHSDPDIYALSGVITYRTPGGGSSVNPPTGVFTQSSVWFYRLIISALVLSVLKAKNKKFQ